MVFNQVEVLKIHQTIFEQNIEIYCRGHGSGGKSWEEYCDWINCSMVMRPDPDQTYYHTPAMILDAILC